MTNTFSLRRRTALLGAAGAAALAFTACGGSSSSSTSTTIAAGSTANAVDRAFVEQMIPHHQMAVEMAQTAAKAGQHPQIARLSADIVRAQNAEIGELRAIATELGVKPAAMSMSGMDMGGDTASAAKALGISADQMGMSMDRHSIETAKPFDRAFIDAMIPHHQGAIRMARAEIARGSSTKLEQIATGIVAAQAKEIGEMNSWRKAWYGAASPAGGVPGA